MIIKNKIAIWTIMHILFVNKFIFVSFLSLLGPLFVLLDSILELNLFYAFLRQLEFLNLSFILVQPSTLRCTSRELLSRYGFVRFICFLRLSHEGIVSSSTIGASVDAPNPNCASASSLLSLV